jgi:hypothetical protein
MPMFRTVAIAALALAASFARAADEYPARAVRVKWGDVGKRLGVKLD